MSDFRILKDNLNKGGCNYRKVMRFDPPKGLLDKKRGNLVKSIAIYGVYSSEESETLRGYEVFKIRIMKGGEIKGNPIPPGEKYPGNEDIGRWGRAFHGKGFEERAWNYYNELKNEIDEESSIKS